MMITDVMTRGAAPPCLRRQLFVQPRGEAGDLGHQRRLLLLRDPGLGVAERVDRQAGPGIAYHNIQ